MTNKSAIGTPTMTDREIERWMKAMRPRLAECQRCGWAWCEGDEGDGPIVALQEHRARAHR